MAPNMKSALDYPLVFLRCRTIAFAAITFFSFIWIILLCVVLFLQWEFMNAPYRYTIMAMLLVDSITAVVLLFLLTRKFRAWLDGARIAFLLAAHLGVAGAFVYYSSGFTCPQPTPEDRAMCRLLILYITISSWVLPTLVLIYAVALGVMTYLRSRRPRSPESSGSDVEKDGDSVERKGKLHNSVHSSFVGSPPSWTSPSPISTPIAAQFATTLATPNQTRFSSGPPLATPTTVDFSQFYLPSPAPIATRFSHSLSSPNPTHQNQAAPSFPVPHHQWNPALNLNSGPPTSRSRHYSHPTALPESIPEETSSYSGDSERSEKRDSARLSKPTRLSRLPYLR